jgi:hypothetical protein
MSAQVRVQCFGGTAERHRHTVPVDPVEAAARGRGAIRHRDAGGTQLAVENEVPGALRRDPARVVCGQAGENVGGGQRGSQSFQQVTQHGVGDPEEPWQLLGESAQRRGGMCFLVSGYFGGHLNSGAWWKRRL